LISGCKANYFRTLRIHGHFTQAHSARTVGKFRLLSTRQCERAISVMHRVYRVGAAMIGDGKRQFSSKSCCAYLPPT